ncbi:hypothetical protein EUX98_g5729 [Antrodiella citrinella]|uniref:Uncharacterized protein n=1 Tax=Antrodiella citrinella TaxID=2447956 RepID=A0A4V3XIA4_9APHY|nr:hypothetical protein EUX98_g5729 [Antrodiella citrinella]
MHKLIFYLFASDVGRHHSVRQPTPRAAKGKAKAISRAISLGRLPSTPTGQKRALAKSASLSAVEPESWTGHVFEVYKANKEQPLVGDEEVVKGIVLPTGRLWRKLSSVRERHIFRDLYGSVESGSKQEGEDSDEEDDWAWEAEDDFTLAHLWPSGPSLRRAIIYRHNPRVSIHITVHKGAIPHRKGVGNLPFVFLSQGSAGDTIKISHDIHNQRNAWHTHADDSDDDLPSLPSSVATTATQINRWNTLGTFMKFLKREDERERRLRGRLPQNPDTDASSDSALPHSDDIPFPSSDADSDYSTCSDSVLFPFASSAITPFPAHPAHRKRVQSAERRLERLTQTGLSKSQLSDEEDEQDVRKKKSRKKRAPSVEIPDGKVKEESNSPEDFNPFVDDEVEI